MNGTKRLLCKKETDVQGSALYRSPTQCRHINSIPMWTYQVTVECPRTYELIVANEVSVHCILEGEICLFITNKV